MHTKINRRKMIAAAIGLTAFAATGMAATTASAGHSSRKIPVDAHFLSPPDTFTVALPCTVDNFIPVTGHCHGSESGTGAVTGSWIGDLGFDFGWVVDPASNATVAGLSTFTGTVVGCGAGTFTYRYDGGSNAAGVGFVTWDVIPSLGTGDLAGLTGHGTQHSQDNPDFSRNADLSGVVRCAHGQPLDHN
jgi:Protein of unknown function (DUF3224)